MNAFISETENDRVRQVEEDVYREVLNTRITHYRISTSAD